MATSLINNSPNHSAIDAAPAPPRQIRFVHSQGHPPSKRRRINAACLTCRRRKTRCAGERPVCSTCTKNGHQCLGYPEDKKDGTDQTIPKLEDDGLDRQEEFFAEEEDQTKSKKPKTTSAQSAEAKPARKPAPPQLAVSDSLQSAHVAGASGGKSDRMKAELGSPSAPVAPMSASPLQSKETPTMSQIMTFDTPESPSQRRNANINHRVPYFRYFGPTAIVPGYKQMVVAVRDRRRSTTGSGSHAGASPLSNPSGIVGNASAVESDVIIDDPPVYDPNDAAPVHPLILSLVKTFFVHLGCNYPFLQQNKFMRMVQEKRVEPILVDAVCAMAARFSDSPLLTGGSDQMPRNDRGQVYAQRAKHATVDTFPCPSVGAVQALLLMAYEGFGANQDSALWMYLGLAIRMAVDLGLQKRVGIKYQGEKDPYNTLQRRKTGETESPEEMHDQAETPSHQEQKELEQERIDTFWALFFLDRAISSGTGRPVTIRDDDFELPFPRLLIEPSIAWPSPFPMLVEIVHLYGRVSDILNNIHDRSDLTQEKWQKLTAMESHLTKVYKGWDPRMQFNVSNFKAYLGVGQGTTFILLHFWFHALFIILHQPTLMSPFGDLRSELQLLSDSRELSMSSAKTICDILAFADLIDPGSFTGNPFTSQPIYIAACAFLMESSATASADSSREASPPAGDRSKATGNKHSRHSLLASAANQNYQRCYTSLQHLHVYWGGVKYILTALDQKAKGIWDCETFTSEEYESTKLPRRDSLGTQLQLNHPASPSVTGPPIAWSLSGTANSPNSSLTLMYQNQASGGGPSTALPPLHSIAKHGSTPPAPLGYDGNRKGGISEAGSMYPPPYPQPTTSAIRSVSRPLPKPAGHLGHMQSQRTKLDDLPDESEGGRMFIPPNYPANHQSSSGYENYGASPTNNMAESSNGNMYYPQMQYQSNWGIGVGNMDSITFNSQDIDIGALGLQQQELMGPWLEYIPGDVLGLFDNQDMGPGGQGGSQ